MVDAFTRLCWQTVRLDEVSYANHAPMRVMRPPAIRRINMRQVLYSVPFGGGLLMLTEE